MGVLFIISKSPIHLLPSLLTLFTFLFPKTTHPTTHCYSLNNSHSSFRLNTNSYFQNDVSALESTQFKEQDAQKENTNIHGSPARSGTPHRSCTENAESSRTGLWGEYIQRDNHKFRVIWTQTHFLNKPNVFARF